MERREEENGRRERRGAESGEKKSGSRTEAIRGGSLLLPFHAALGAQIFQFILTAGRKQRVLVNC